MQCVSIAAQHAEHMKGCIFTQATKQGPWHCNALLRVRLVCCAKHHAASFACCMASGTAQLQHMQCVSTTAQHAEHMKGCMFTQATKQGPWHCNALLRVRLVCCAKHHAASFACCMASGTAQLQHMQCVSIAAQHAQHMKGCMFTQATKQSPWHCNALLRERLVCCAKHHAASFACCMASGTAQLQHMQCVSIAAQHAQHMKGCMFTQATKQGPYWRLTWPATVDLKDLPAGIRAPHVEFCFAT